MNLQSLSPILWVKNLQETIRFYENALGFVCQSNFPNFASLSKGDVQIMFICPEETFFEKPMLTGSIYIFTENVNEVWDVVKDKVEIKTAIADREYWMRDFSILDNNGYELVFGQDISNK
jgi:catechol 2,3-dioxygenase-like lactoylglutathione lyase family enzyme